ncbi:hypothetical protein SAMN02745136_05074 [Anaerocolumna jejuensis DSM 15929]|uniref:Uncharacterized protein n=1 Tax=Anaerocolumna jejuensis DSM 15929 TaxID=1121322 RepID=A0A1M7BBS0_9FIRM|nr:hypothetical protein SAMN02745136_05074 [Anaerocolumna jejuensis DSM 15929]
MVFADSKDIRNCTEIVKKELLKNNVNVNDDILNKITLDVMNIFYSKAEIILIRLYKALLRHMLKKGFIKKFIE